LKCLACAFQFTSGGFSVIGKAVGLAAGLLLVAGSFINGLFDGLNVNRGAAKGNTSAALCKAWKCECRIYGKEE
jgi:hypothetical protein